jgi:hypothetical protein
MSLVQITDHVDQALDRLQEQFKDKPNIIGLITALLTNVQEVENEIFALYSERGLDTAEGAQLDQIGVIVGQPRAGLADGDYRRRLRARIAVNNSGGTVGEMIVVTRLIINDITLSVLIDNDGGGVFEILILDEAITSSLGETVLAFAQDAASAGVRMIVTYYDATTYADGSLYNTGLYNTNTYFTSKDEA